ncbi:MAG: hypothetical protein WCJ86_04305 [Candidatus Saccharibacteria bacterium]
MIRDFKYNPKTTQIVEILQRFGFDVVNEKIPFALLRFEVLTPVSFMWRLLVDGAVYYLYAEDYVPGLDHIKSVFESYTESDKWELVSPSKTILFESASPVKRASVYQKPKDAVNMMKYAVDSGYDFVFLIKSQEDADDSQFSDHAPRGFSSN